MEIIITVDELMDKGIWDEFCEGRGISVWAVNEGQMDYNQEFILTKEEVKKFGFLDV